MEKSNAAKRKRVLARGLAVELSTAELERIGGHGTSYNLSGCNAQGLGGDLTAVDCVQGSDSVKCV